MPGILNYKKFKEIFFIVPATHSGNQKIVVLEYEDESLAKGRTFQSFFFIQSFIFHNLS